jgi:iron complex transport system substrate-binding protein
MILSCFYPFLRACFLLCFLSFSVQAAPTSSTLDSSKSSVSKKRSVARPQSPFKRIVSLGGGVSETVFALGLGADVVAVDVSSIYPPEALQKPKVGYVRATSAEGIASMKPDLVLSSEVFGPPAVRKQLKQAGIRVELVSESKSIESAVERIQAIGRILKRDEQAKVLAQRIQKVIQMPVPTGPKPRVLFLFSHGGTSLLIAGDDTGATTMIKAAGGQNAVSGYTGYKPFDCGSCDRS